MFVAELESKLTCVRDLSREIASRNFHGYPKKERNYSEVSRKYCTSSSGINARRTITNGQSSPPPLPLEWRKIEFSELSRCLQGGWYLLTFEEKLMHVLITIRFSLRVNQCVVLFILNVLSLRWEFCRFWKFMYGFLTCFSFTEDYPCLCLKK